MDRYPEYIFTGSQVKRMMGIEIFNLKLMFLSKAQQYEWLRELYPPVFEKIQQKEKAGQWEIIGGVCIQSTR